MSSLKTAFLAAGTAAIALALAWPIAATATDRRADPVRFLLGVLPVAKMTNGTCEITVTDAERKLAGPGTPEFELVVVNRGEKAQTFTLALTASRMPAASMGSRMLPMPKVEWTKSIEISVAAGASVKVPVRPAVAMKVGETLTLAATNGEAMQALASVLVEPSAERRLRTVAER